MAQVERLAIFILLSIHDQFCLTQEVQSINLKTLKPRSRIKAGFVGMSLFNLQRIFQRGSFSV